MASFLFTIPSDRVTGTLSSEVGFGPTGTYPFTNLLNDRLDVPYKTESLNNFSVRMDLGAPTRVDVCALFNHNISSGLSGLVYLLADNEASRFNGLGLSTSFTIPPRGADGFSADPWLNLKALYPLAANRTFRYWWIISSTINDVKVSIGEWAMYRNLYDLGIRNVPWGGERHTKRPSILHESELGVRRSYDLGTTIRTMAVEPIATDVNIANIDQWYRDAAGVARPFTIIPHVDQNDAWFVSFVNQEHTWTRAAYNANPTRLMFQEMSRGLRP